MVRFCHLCEHARKCLLFVKVTLVKIHLHLFFDKVFALCELTYFSKYYLPDIHCQINVVHGNVALMQFQMSSSANKAFDR